MLLSFLMLRLCFFSSLFAFFGIPAILSGMILPEMFHRMSIRKNKSYSIVRMHFDMFNIISKMIITQHFNNQVDQYLFGNLLG